MPDFKENFTFISAAPIPPDHVDRVALVRSVSAFHAVVPLVRFRTHQTAPGVFSYLFEAVDGRVWTQTIDFSASTSDPALTFSVPAGWKLSEFAFQRPIRDLVVRLIPAFGATEIKMVYP